MGFTPRALSCVFMPLCLAATLAAQDKPVVRKGNTEAGGFVGASYGIDEFRIMGGGNVAYALTRVIMPYAEFSYFPGIGRTQTFANGTRWDYSIPLTDFHGGVHIRIPIRESRVIPYGVFGLGMIHSPSRTENALVTTSLGSVRLDVPVSSSTDFAVNFGGGLRYYVNERFGFRVEAKAYRPTGQFTDVFGKVEGGFFFSIR
jgi:hypothetical protein